jgi:hypothetical protein
MQIPNSNLRDHSNALNEFNLPVFSDSASQMIGNFLKYLDSYFELKGVPEQLKLPLASRAIQDPFAKSWLNAEYSKLANYQQFKLEITQLLWNDLQQSAVRCKIFQGKFDERGNDTMAGHYLKYVNLAGSLSPPLSEIDLTGALTAHYSAEVQMCIISANLKSTQEVITFLGQLQALEEDKGSRKRDLNDNQKDYGGDNTRGTERQLELKGLPSECETSQAAQVA